MSDRVDVLSYFCFMRPCLEICCDSLDSLNAALRGGADRIELCSALTEGGITPSIGFVRTALRISTVPVHVLVRPRGGDFLYSESEWQSMLDDVRSLCDAGVQGVVIGGLLADGEIDMEHTLQLVQAAEGLSVTFHRAFDMCRSPERSIPLLAEAGIDCILTSGGAPDALAGASRIAGWREKFGGRLRFMPGCGVTSGNAARILHLTGACEIHASAKRSQPSGMLYRQDNVKMGSAERDEYSRLLTDETEVKRLREVLGSSFPLPL